MPQDARFLDIIRVDLEVLRVCCMKNFKNYITGKVQMFRMMENAGYILVIFLTSLEGIRG